jgi:cell division protein FtsW (lipid II flippase)
MQTDKALSYLIVLFFVFFLVVICEELRMRYPEVAACSIVMIIVFNLSCSYVALRGMLVLKDYRDIALQAYAYGS